MKLNLPNRQRLLVIATAAVAVLYILDAVVITRLSDIWTEHAAEIAGVEAVFDKIGNGADDLVARGEDRPEKDVDAAGRAAG